MGNFLQEWKLTGPKRSNSAKRPLDMEFDTSKTKKFCETSSIFDFDNTKNEAILRDFPQKWKVECKARARTNAFCDFFSPCV